jgi:hypothetical protein
MVSPVPAGCASGGDGASRHHGGTAISCPRTTEAVIRHYAEQFLGGFFGPLSYYRPPYTFPAGHPPSRPRRFGIAEHEGVVARNPSAVEGMAELLPDYRGHVLIEGVGDWTQQEAPEAFNRALIDFLDSLPAPR